jgi:hypothetical protein
MGLLVELRDLGAGRHRTCLTCRTLDELVDLALQIPRLAVNLVRLRGAGGVRLPISELPDQIIEFVEETGRHAEHLDAIRGYREEYGVSA